MSHFTVTVVTPEPPTNESLAAILQPWHEYECTGVEDQYVVDVDVTEDLLADFAKYGKEGQSFDDFVSGWSSAEKHDDGRWYRHTNPNAKWDWWVVGGRWQGHLPLKSGEVADSAAVVDIAEMPSTFAIVKDGQWFERGKMGWWACVSDEKAEDEWDAEVAKLLSDLPPDAHLSIVDCHI